MTKVKKKTDKHSFKVASIVGKVWENGLRWFRYVSRTNVDNKNKQVIKIDERHENEKQAALHLPGKDDWI